MKKILNGKSYNTKTAQKIGSGGEGSGSDFRTYGETLYRTKSGRFFTVGSGGPLTPYAVSHGNETSGSTDVFRVLTTSEALAWCEQNDVDADVIEKLFDIEDA